MRRDERAVRRRALVYKRVTLGNDVEMKENLYTFLAFVTGVFALGAFAGLLVILVTL